MPDRWMDDGMESWMDVSCMNGWMGRHADRQRQGEIEIR